MKISNFFFQLSRPIRKCHVALHKNDTWHRKRPPAHMARPPRQLARMAGHLGNPATQAKGAMRVWTLHPLLVGQGLNQYTTNTNSCAYEDFNFIYIVIAFIFPVLCEFSTLQSPFWHSKLSFLEKLWTNESWEIYPTFTSKTPFAISTFQSKVIHKIQSGCEKMWKKIWIWTPLWTLSITFYWMLQITNGFLEVRTRFIFQLPLVQSFSKKLNLLCLNGLWSMLTSMFKG